MSEGKKKAMLELLKLKDVGLPGKIEWHLAPRLNLITGDNGLGKTFLLECAWWALTGTWVGYPPYPPRDVPKNIPTISMRIGKESQSNKTQTINYNWDRLEWTPPTKHNVLPGLSIFAQVDESFTIWDPAKYALSGDNFQSQGTSPRSTTYLLHFTQSQVRDGVRIGEGDKMRVLCNGLINDWIYWQNADPARFEAFSAALKALSPHSTDEPLIPGQPTRLPDDARMIPTLKFPYGEVPILHCSASFQRIVALAYLLVWAWDEHVTTSILMRKTPEQSIVLLIDEIEAHLHPLWQRNIVPALMDVTQVLDNEVQIQMIATTHSPLVLASVEARFDHNRDSLFHLYPENHEVKLDDVPFVKRGRVDQWLMSDIFELKQPRSTIAEEAIEEAKSLQLMKEPAQKDVQRVHNKLVQVLAPDDEFWPRWTYFAEQRGVHL